MNPTNRLEVPFAVGALPVRHARDRAARVRGAGGRADRCERRRGLSRRRTADTARLGVRERARLAAWKLSRLALAAAVFGSTSHLAASDPATAPDTQKRTLTGSVVSISDGDTLTLLVDREQIRIRLAQIDAPEIGQPYGKKAKAALSALAFRKQARVEVVDIDRYGRTVGEVFADGIDVNREMVREGHAWAYTKYSHTTEIIELEGGARAANKGLWALPESQREPPWLWRHPPGAPRPEPGPLVCGTRSYCSEMANCDEARFYFERCGVHALDGNGDGVPCESLCAVER